MSAFPLRLFAAFLALAVLRCAAAEPNPTELLVTPFHASGIYETGEKAGWTLALPSPDSIAPALTYIIKKNNFDVIATGTLEFIDARATLETSLSEPAMLFVEVKPAVMSHTATTTTANIVANDPFHLVLGAAIAPERIAPSEPAPDDFDAFWHSKIALLHEIPTNPILKSGETELDGVEYATLTLDNINGARVYGQLAKPAREGKFPAMLLLQWAGGPYPLQKKWVTQRAAEGWLVLNIEPHDVPGDLPREFYAALPAMIRRYNTIYNDDRDRNYFLQMYLGAYRAADYLTSRPDWNGETFLVTGTSMGGQQSLAVCGLHSKPTHMIVHVPAGADANGNLHGRAAGYPNWESHNPRVAATARYFDTVHFAARIRAKSLVSMGFLDTVCPPVGIWAAFNQIPAAKEAAPLPASAHNHQSPLAQQRAFIDRDKAWRAALVRGEEPELLWFAAAKASVD